MKLVFAIFSSDSYEAVASALSGAGYQSTKLASTGNFLRRGNTTLMIGVDDEKVANVADLIKKACGERRTVTMNMPCMPAMLPGNQAMMMATTVPVPVETGGAVLFVVNVDQFERI